jgi:peptidoglycan/LPS O-acetylase OafA/YrhL
VLYNDAKRIPQLDLLRSLAIASVFIFHLALDFTIPWLKPFGRYGWVGVDLFFVLSGFLITSQLLKSLVKNSSISLKDFYIRRGFRIWPAYFFVLALYLLIPGFPEKSGMRPAWYFITFIQNFGLNAKTEGAFSHAWSLCVEEQFYLVLPAILLIMHRFGNPRRVVAFASSLVLGGILLRFVLWNHFVGPIYDSPSADLIYLKEIYYPTYTRLDGLLVGVSIAALYRLRPLLWKRMTESSNRFLLAGFCILAFASVVLDHKTSRAASTFGFPLIALGFGALLVSALSPTGWFSRAKVPGAKLGATLAFSFYLTHKEMITLSGKWFGALNRGSTQWLFLSLTFGVCLMTSSILYLLVERPFLQWRDKIFRK